LRNGTIGFAIACWLAAAATDTSATSAGLAIQPRILRSGANPDVTITTGGGYDCGSPVPALHAAPYAAASLLALLAVAARRLCILPRSLGSAEKREPWTRRPY
jgi:hypothetical protein